MGNLDGVLEGLEPKGPADLFGYDKRQEEAYEILVRDGRCSNSREAKLAHLAIFDARAVILFTEDEDDDEIDKIQSVISHRLIPEAKKHCFKCPVLSVCTDYSLDLKRMDEGVLGGMAGTTRRSIGFEAEIQQVCYPRIRDMHSFPKAG